MYRKRWITYADLLGIKELISQGKMGVVYNSYALAIEQAKQKTANSDLVTPLWFSDTFLFVGEDDSKATFSAIEQATRWFFYFMITDNVPLRGAIGYGDLFYDKNNGVVFGPSLVNVYQYAESQEWINFSLTKEATERVVDYGFDIGSSLHYKNHEIPLKCGHTIDRTACVLGSWGKVNGRNVIETLQTMSEKINDKKILIKYQNTISFLRKYGATTANKSPS